MNFTRLIEHVSKKQVPAHVTFFIVEVMASDAEGEDVEVWCMFITTCLRTDFLRRSFRLSLSIASDLETYGRKEIRLVECIRCVPSVCPKFVCNNLYRGGDREWNLVANRRPPA